MPPSSASRFAALCLAVTLPVFTACSTAPSGSSTQPVDPATGRYVNTDGKSINTPFSDLVSWMWSRNRQGLPPAPSKFVKGYDFPVVRDGEGTAPAKPGELSATWIGHATVLLRVGGLNVLTDPHFSDRAFMVQWAGPQRKVPLPYALSQLPHIDLVVISHNHYDHLDKATVLALNQQAGGPPVFAVPVGLGEWFRGQDISNVREVAWGEQQVVGGVQVHSVPVHHWSSRTPFDRNKTAWGGWVFKSPQHTVFFAGDTGYSKDFEAIGQRFGMVDLALIPVGAYEPRWFMRGQHVNPAEAVRIHQDVHARQSIGIHWGTFELTDEPLDEPMGELPKAVAEAKLDPKSFVLLRHGQTWRQAGRI
jgi:N-acyl-phosphatidylethanolamine-hydrolysing phospholipase D